MCEGEKVCCGERVHLSWLKGNVSHSGGLRYDIVFFLLIAWCLWSYSFAGELYSYCNFITQFPLTLKQSPYSFVSIKLVLSLKGSFGRLGYVYANGNDIQRHDTIEDHVGAIESSLRNQKALLRSHDLTLKEHTTQTNDHFAELNSLITCIGDITKSIALVLIEMCEGFEHQQNRQSHYLLYPVLVTSTPRTMGVRRTRAT